MLSHEGLQHGGALCSDVLRHLLLSRALQPHTCCERSTHIQAWPQVVSTA